MVRTALRLLPVALACLVAGSAATRAATTAKRVVVEAPGWIESIAMDGRIVAYDVRARDGCNVLHTWNVATGADTVVSGPVTCAADSTSTGAGVREIAVAGTELAWIVDTGGNTESTDTLLRGTVGRRGERKVASATRTGDVDGTLRGGWIGNLAGDGRLIAFNRWVTPATAAADTTLARLRTGTGTAIVATGAEARRVAAADTGRVAILEDDGTVRVVDASGRDRTRFAPAAAAREVALRKDFVVVLEAGPQLEIRDARTGAAVGTIRVPSGARFLDVHANIAALAVGKSVVAIRLATGRRATVALAPRAVRHVAIDDAGLVYAYDGIRGGKEVGTLTFVPLSLVQAATS